MQTALNALTDELRRLKSAGVGRVSVGEDSLASLHSAVTRLAKSRQASVVQLPPSPASANLVVKPAAPRPTASATLPAFPAPPVVVLPEGDKKTRLSALREQVMSDGVCQAHVRPGKKVVFGVGDMDASILFVGEAPGAEEEIQGEPFVGPAGQLLSKMIAGMGISREQVYIANIMNWRPEMEAGSEGYQVGNRPPTREEIAYCMPYLRAQVDLVAPKLVVALGATAAQAMLGAGSFRALGEVRGKWREFAGIPLMITYHPSYIIRSATNASKRLIWEDLLKVMERSGLPISEKQRSYFLSK